MKKRYRYAIAGGLLGAGGAVLLAFPLLFLTELYLKGGGDKAAARTASLAVTLFFACAPALAGYAWGRRRELLAEKEAPAQPPAPAGPLTALQIALGAIGAFAGAVLAYIAVVAALILSAFVLPRSAMRALDNAPDAALYAMHLGSIALIVLSGWGGFRLAASLGRRSGKLPGD